MTCCMLSYAIK